MKSLILELHNKIHNKSLTIIDLVKQSQQKDNEFAYTNATLARTYDTALGVASNLQLHIDEHKNELLYGIPYSLKDLVSTKGVVTTGGSKILEGYIPPYDAHIYSMLKKAHALLVSKSNCDEYGMGGTGLHSGYGDVINHIDKERIVGGSSSGGVSHVAAGVVPFSIGTDTGDSVRAPASFMGLVGYVPTYGIISRYGVIPYAPSFDHIGVITKYVADAAIVAQNLVEYDEKDYTSQKINDSSFFQNLKKKEKITFTVLTGIENYCDESVRTEYLNFLNQIKAKYSIKEYRLSEDILRALAPTYMILTYAEACSCHGNKTSIPFGKYVGGHGYDEIIIKARTEGFSSQVKRRMTIGAYITSAQNFESIFLKAKKVRTLIINEVNNILSGSDCLLLPGNSSVAHKIEHIKGGTLNKENLIGADTLMFANFAGIPSITIPLKTNGLPFGINISCSQFHDQDAFDIAYTLEEMIRGDNE